MKRHRVILALAAALLCGWGPDGHRIVGAIASRHLTDEARSSLLELLGAETLADAGNWADEIRGDSSYDWARPLHYVNVPRDAEHYDMGRDCPDGRCVVEAIRRYAGVLGDPAVDRSTRVEALKFLVHFVADVHQPLHVSYQDDLGGNRVDVIFFGQRTNLHRLWDSGLLRRQMRTGWQDLVVRLDNGFSAEQVRIITAVTDPATWADESLAITRTHCYSFPPDGQIGDEYYRRTIGLVNQRLGEAGLRLAAVLNDLLDNRVIVDPPPPPGSGPAPAGRPAGAIDAVAIEMGDPCGPGREVMLVNRDASRPVRVVVEKSWSDGVKSRSVRTTAVVRPGEAHRRRLGCSRAGRGEDVREYTWTIVDAEFREG